MPALTGAVAAGFFGKIPARGDFVHRGLPAPFVAALDAWWQGVLRSSQASFGPRWAGLWMQAPVWRFLMAPGVCGPSAVAGLWLPSVDRAGRCFPLTFALLAGRWQDMAGTSGFLDGAEALGFRVLNDDLAPDALAAGVVAAARLGGAVPDGPARGCTRWWTQGGPFVPATARHHGGLPTGPGFDAMLCSGDGGQPASPLPPVDGG